jgi:monoamine oxidase
MARTPLLRSLLEMARSERIADALGLPPSALRERQALARERRAAAMSRRAFLGGAAGVTGALVMGCAGSGASQTGPATPGPAAAPPARGSKIVIIGAGISGLSAALELADAGIRSTVYEASGRTGGRMWSDSRYFDGGQVFEVHGELIDGPHATMWALAKRFHIEIDDLVAAQPKGGLETYHFFGKHYPHEDAMRDLAVLRPLLDQDAKLAGNQMTWDATTPHGRMLDDMSVYDWIEQRVPGGHGSPLGMLLETAYFIEMNSDTREQSALNIVYPLASQPDWEHFTMYGSSDEKYKTRGGNQRFTDAIAAALPPDTVQHGRRLESIARRSSGDYALTIRRAGTVEQVIADHVILTLPFAVLRELDYEKAGFDDRKHHAIQELGRGRQSKQHLQFKRRIWYEKGPRPVIGTGTSYSDQGCQVTWESTRAQGGAPGILVAYCGGPHADAMSSKVAYSTATSSGSSAAGAQADARRFLSQAEPLFPGLAAEWNGKSFQCLPHLDPNLKCSYAFWRKGQYQSIRGYERVPQGRVYFAGEHTSSDFQGFMEGGAAEGMRAAREVLASLGVKR